MTIARNAEAPLLPAGPTPVASAWTPLRHAMFRALWIASLTSNVGTWMQSVAAVWLMTSLSASPVMVALVQTAASLPLVFLALPAGALADMVDRRKLLLASQTWMLLASASLGVLTLRGLEDPWLLLGLTFAMGIGTALTAPAWLAITLELVPRSELPAAVALSSASLNLARAIGPAIGGLIVAATGAGPAFLLNAASFLAVLGVLFAWRREPTAMVLPREHVFGAIRAGMRFVRHSPALQRILLRVGMYVFFTSSIWALLPVLAKQRMDAEAAGYGVLLGCIGVGAVIGAFTLPRLRDALSADRIVDLGGAVFAAMLILIGVVPSFGLACVLLVAVGFAWMSPLSTLNVETQSVAPAWVRARALALHLLVLQGGLAGGSALWGWVADRVGSPLTLQIAGAGLAVSVLVSLRLRLRPTAHIDLSPAVRWPAKEIIEAAEYDEGPVLVSVEYEIDPAREDEFLRTMEIVRRMRRRSGAWRWGVFRDAAQPNVYLESFLVESWLDHLRQHERMTVTDRDISYRARAFHVCEGPADRAPPDRAPADWLRKGAPPLSLHAAKPRGASLSPLAALGRSPSASQRGRCRAEKGDREPSGQRNAGITFSANSRVARRSSTRPNIAMKCVTPIAVNSRMRAITCSGVPAIMRSSIAAPTPPIARRASSAAGPGARRRRRRSADRTSCARFARVAPDVGAVPVEDRHLVRELRRRAAHVPHLRVARDELQQHLLTAAADDDRWVRLLYRLRPVPGLRDLVVLAREVGAVVAPHAHADLERFSELLEALLDGRERVAVGLVLLLEPAGAEAELEAAAGDRVEARRHLRDQRGAAIRVAADQDAEADAAGLACEGREGTHASSWSACGGVTTP